MTCRLVQIKPASVGQLTTQLARFTQRGLSAHCRGLLDVNTRRAFGITVTDKAPHFRSVPPTYAGQTHMIHAPR